MAYHKCRNTRFSALWSGLVGVTLLFCCAIMYYSVHYYNKTGSSPIGWSSFEQAALSLNSEACKSVCTTKDCIETASEVIYSMNEKADPCEDFFQFACGNFHEKYGPENNYSGVKSLVDSFNRILRDVIETSKETEYPDSAAQKLKIVYDSCMDTGSLELSDIPSMQSFLNQIGIRNWPNMNMNFTFSNPMLAETLGRLATFEENIFFYFEYVKNDTLYIDMSYIDCENCTNEVVKDIIRDILKYAGMNDADINDTWESFVEIENIIIELKQNNSDEISTERHFYQDYQVHQCNTEEEQGKDMLCEILHSVVTYGGLANSFTTKKLNIYSRIIPYIQGVSRFLQSYNHRALAQYIALKVVLNNLKYMNTFFRNIFKILIDQSSPFFGEESDKRLLENDRWKYCLKYAKSHMELPLGFLYIAEMFSPEAIDEISVMVKEYQKVTGEFIRAQDSISESTRTKMIKEVENVKKLITDVIKSIQNGTVVNSTYKTMDKMSVQKRRKSNFVLTPDFRVVKYSWDYVAKEIEKEKSYIIDIMEWYQNRTKIDEPYKTFHPLKNDFLYNVMFHKKRHFTSIHLERNSLENEMESYYLFDDLFSVNAYNLIGIHLMFGILLPPYYKHGHPNLFNIAQLGQIVAHEIGHSVYGVLQMSKHSDNQTRLYMENNLKCRNAQYSNFELKKIGQKLNANSTENDDFADNVAIQVSERVVTKLFRNKIEKSFALSGAHFSSEELFYILYSQPWCAVRSTEMDWHILKRDKHSPSEYRVYGPLQNSRRFSEIFNCSEKSYMNPKEKCPVFY